MGPISASNLKTQDVSAIAQALKDAPEAMVSMPGKDRLVVMGIERYQYLREHKLTPTLAESQADMVAGRFVRESVNAHMNRLTRL